MNKQLIDPGYSPSQWLVLLLRDGQPRFVGVESEQEAKKMVADSPGLAVIVEYMVSASSGNTRVATLGEAIQTKAYHKGPNEGIVGIQPAVPPANLAPELAKVWWEAPRDSDFPQFQTGK